MTLRTHKSLNINSYRGRGKKRRKDQLENWEIFLIYCPITIIIWQSRTHTESLNSQLRGAAFARLASGCESRNESSWPRTSKTCHPSQQDSKIYRLIKCWNYSFRTFYFFTDYIFAFAFARLHRAYDDVDIVILIPLLLLVFSWPFSITIKSFEEY